MKRVLFLIVIVAVLFSACKKKGGNTPAQNVLPKEYTTAIVQNYGSFYKDEGFEHQVFTLDLYSKGISFDSLGYLHGSGYNLYFSDIFLPEKSMLLDTVYTIDSIPKIATFLKGMDFEGNYTGAYLLSIVDGQLDGISLVTDGSFAIETANDSILMSFNVVVGEKTKYAATYKGNPYYIDNSKNNASARLPYILKTREVAR
ncbi:MAG: hypothetical protein IJS73_03110 [Paludibacteraceae bacterium]|nr:hypothetical protein [Paludibacteraceae bacterium]